VNVELPDGRYLRGSVSAVREATILTCTYSSLKAKQRLAAWVRFLVLSASSPDFEVSAVAIGLGKKISNVRQVARSAFSPLPGPPAVRRQVALDKLARLVDLFDRGMREPLPIFCGTSAEAVEAARFGDDVEKAATKVWKSDYNWHGEDEEPEHVQIFGPEAPFGPFLEQPPLPDDPVLPRPVGSRFELYAHLLWDDLIDHPERLDGV